MGSILKTLILFFLISNFVLSQTDGSTSILTQTDSSSAIYFDNFESIVFEQGKQFKTLNFTLQGTKGLVAVVIIHNEDYYLVQALGGDAEGKVVKIKDVHFMMPNLIAGLMDRHPKAKLSEINKVVELIY